MGLPMAYELLSNPEQVRAAFRLWHQALLDGSEWQEHGWWLPDQRIAFANRSDRKEPDLGDFVVLGTDPTLADVTVQLNVPQQFGNENARTGILRDDQGRLYLARQAALTENAVSPRIDAPLFLERTRLEPVDVQLDGRDAKRTWILVTPLDVSAEEMRSNIAAFVGYCDLARSGLEAEEAAKDDERLDELFGKDEEGGETVGAPSVNKNVRTRIQGEVWRALQLLLQEDGRRLRKPRHARGYEVDGVIETRGGDLLLEIKTSSSAASVYGGLGQLQLYPKLLPRLEKHRKVLLLPGTPSKPLVKALEAVGVDLHSYVWKRKGKKISVTFSRSFLGLCDLQASKNSHAARA